MNTLRMFDSVHDGLFHENDEFGTLSNIYNIHGAYVKEFELSNFNCVMYASLANMLNSMPNLEILRIKMTGKDSERIYQTQMLRLNCLKRLEIYNCVTFPLVEYFSVALPQNIIHEFRMNHFLEGSMEHLRKFFDSQTMIKRLQIEGRFTDATIFHNLNLTHFKCKLYNIDSSNHYDFLRVLVSSQTALIKFSLDLIAPNLTVRCVNNEIFREVCKLKNLKSLKMNIDAIDPSVTSCFKDLSELKTFDTSTGSICFLIVFNQLSMLENLPLEHLILDVRDFEISAETFKRLGRNYKLKSLKIALGTRQKIDFFMEHFPTLRALSLRIYTSRHNEIQELSQVFTDDNHKYLNIKTLIIVIERSGMQNSKNAPELVIKIIESLPNLEKFEFDAWIPFSSKFIARLASSLSLPSILKINQMKVEQNESFSNETIQSFKMLGEKLSFGEFRIVHEEGFVYSKFIFESLISSLKHIYRLKSNYYFCTNKSGNLKSFNHLLMSVGEERKDDLAWNIVREVGK